MMRTVAGTAALTVIFLSALVLNPINDTVTVYVPPGSTGIVKAPLSPVKDVYLTPVASFCTTMSAQGMRAPDEATTVPESEAAVLPPCARATEVMVSTDTRRKKKV